MIALPRQIVDPIGPGHDPELLPLAADKLRTNSATTSARLSGTAVSVGSRSGVAKPWAPRYRSTKPCHRRSSATSVLDRESPRV